MLLILVFAANSDYFKTAFGTHWTSSTDVTDNNTDNNTGTEVTDNTKAAFTEVSFTVQEDEIVAFKAILKFFYTSILPEDLMISDLLIMFRLCDVLICKNLMQTIESRLESTSCDDIDNNDLISFFNFDVSIIACTALNFKFTHVLVNRMANLHDMLM